MMSKWFRSRRFEKRDRASHGHSSRPQLEGLESRLLLYATLGANWTYGSRITYSFVPDGTNIGGMSSNLYSTLNAKFSTATWQAQFQKAAAVWQTYANINLVNVSDNGTRLGGGNYQQGDPNMGDIRISMAPLGSSQLAFAFLPPPINGGSDAGDIVFNSNIAWQINSPYDLMTVAVHEFGHALGMDHSSISTASMYPTYTGIKQSLTSDDIAGIQSVYGAPQADAFDSGGANNNNYTTSTNLTSSLNSQGQIALSGVNLNTTSDNDWYYVTAPATTTGTMTVTMQSSNLSSLSPRLMVYSSALGGLGQASAANTYGATVTVTITGVTAGQSYYLRAMAASSPGAIGAYGLLVNFGSQAQSPIAPPNTQVLNQEDSGGGSASQTVGRSWPGWNTFRSRFPDLEQIQIGNWKGWGDGMEIGPGPSASPQSGIQTFCVSATPPGSHPTGVAALDTASFSAAAPGISPGQASIRDRSPERNSALNTLARTIPVFQAIDHALKQWDSETPGSILDDTEDMGPA